jgi:hypothetical protein
MENAKITHARTLAITHRHALVGQADITSCVVTTYGSTGMSDKAQPGLSVCSLGTVEERAVPTMSDDDVVVMVMWNAMNQY